MTNSEKEFLRDIKKNLDESVANIDGATCSHLNRIRTEVLDLHRPKPNPTRNWLWAGSAALPALALGIFIYFGLPEQPAIDLQPPQIAVIPQETTVQSFDVAAVTSLHENINAEGLEILLDEENIDMLSDLDFLTWLSSEVEVEG